jgi:putative oxygen-independent coproporphyrinogen III oxidase
MTGSGCWGDKNYQAMGPMNASATEIAPFSRNLQDWKAPRAAYVHIPFCRRRCYYCDFPISVIGDRLRGEASGSIVQYVNWLCQEIRATNAASVSSGGQSLHTIFFGGGTPSLLSAAQVDQVIEALARQFSLADPLEVSMEMDPGTFTLEQVEDYRKAGVNRVSLGSQAFQDELLQRCGRTHTVSEIYEAVDWVRWAGIENLSLDLISGLPDQTLAQWEASLQEAIAIDPQHISAYDLVVEPGTVFGKRYEPGEFPLPTDDLAAQMYRSASELLRAAGYDHYEISNYAKAGYRCAHNQTYWRNDAYYGFGMGATSYTQGQRFSRPRNRAEYAQWLKTYIANEGRIDCPTVSMSDRLFETLMLGLRRSQGVNLQALSQQFDLALVERLSNCLKPYQSQGWVVLKEDGTLHFSDPEGFLFSNCVLVSLWETLSD